jgi:hypothetical protein
MCSESMLKTSVILISKLGLKISNIVLFLKTLANVKKNVEMDKVTEHRLLNRKGVISYKVLS